VNGGKKISFKAGIIVFFDGKKGKIIKMRESLQREKA